MQSRLFIKILVLQAERLVAVRCGFPVAVSNKTAPSVITSLPDELAVAVRHLPWDANLVTVEVIDGMFGIITVFITLRQRLVTARLAVNVGKSAVDLHGVLLMRQSRLLLHQTPHLIIAITSVKPPLAAANLTV